MNNYIIFKEDIILKLNIENSDYKTYCFANKKYKIFGSTQKSHLVENEIVGSLEIDKNYENILTIIEE